MNIREINYGRVFVLSLFENIHPLIAQSNNDYGAGIVARRMLWYESPYIWIGAALIFMGILFLFIRRNERN